MDDSAFERHYRVGELAKLWSIGRQTLRLLFVHEPGVVKIRIGKKLKNTTMLIPADVAARVHLRLQNNGR